ncbi:M56 family metallopeptidase [bacterium 1xD42-67]|nr:M56 family metallopeptidase [bacterium 1xD42-67]
MDRILLALGGLALGGSAAVIALALAGRSTWSRYGARWRCWIWLLLCLRLAVPLPLMPRADARAPIQVDLPTTPAAPQPPALPAPPAGGAQLPVQPGPGVQGGQTLPNDGPAVTPSGVPEAGQARRDLSRSQILMAVWLAGAAAMLLWELWAHLRFLSYLRRWSSPVTEDAAIHAFNALGDQLDLDERPRLLVCQGLKVPMLAGAFRPAILLPQGSMSGEDLGFSLLHELTHYRRRDIWLKLLAAWVNALYWFDPLMWYMVRLVERDTELACDEDALRLLPREAYSAYGQTILTAVARAQEGEK